MALQGTVTRCFIAPLTYGGSTGNLAVSVKYASGASRLASDDTLSSHILVLQGLSGDVSGSGSVWIQFFDSVALPIDTTACDYSIGPITAPNFFSAGQVIRPFVNGLSWCVSSTNPTKTVAGAVGVLQLIWVETR